MRTYTHTHKHTLCACDTHESIRFFFSSLWAATAAAAGAELLLLLAFSIFFTVFDDSFACFSFAGIHEYIEQIILFTRTKHFDF